MAGDVGQWTKEEISELKAIFTLLDKDGDGAITMTELGTAMRASGQEPTKAELKDFIRRFDSNGDGAIDFSEFLSIRAESEKDNDKRKQLRELFKEFDIDGNGFITAAELRQSMMNAGENVSEEEVTEMIRLADIDNDGQVNYTEFVKYFTAMK